MDIQDGQDFVLVGDNDLHGYDEEFLPQPPKVLAGILKWLQPTDYLGEASEYKKHLSSYVAGTDLWIQETEAYRQWHDSPDHGALWTKAIAGAGKSVFAAIITAQLAQTEDIPVLFFFFRQIIATNHDPHSMARDWIAMVLEHSPSLQAKMKNYMDDHRMLENISTNEFWQDLVRALALLPKVYCIVDALDEMDIDQEDFLKSLVALGKRKPSSIKLMMTSRPLPRIESFLKDSSILQIRLEQLKVDKDIALYIGYRLRDRTDLDDSVRTAINHSIGQKSQGSFLYARLMMDEILDHTKQMVPKVDFLQRSLDWLPVTLEDMYNGMLLDHSLRSRVPQELQLTILQWVTHSSRPLRLLELAAMLDCQSDTGRVAKDTKAVVRAACGPLLEILEDETVSVIHHSFTEFLIDAERRTRPASEAAHPQFPIIDPVTTHHKMTLACLKYLTSGCLDEWKLKDVTQSYGGPFSTSPCRSLQSQHTISMRYPFFEYAMSNWYIHASKLESIGAHLLEALDSFMAPEDRTFLSWLDINWPDKIQLTKVSPLHVASWAGMTTYVQYLLQREVESNGLDGRERTPLSWASARGNVDVVALLLQSVTQPDLDDYNGHKPLHYAALANHHKIVKLLLAAGVSPTTGKTRDPGRLCGNARSSIGDSPLMYCCNAGSVESVREMFPYLKRENLNAALCWAARSGKTEVVELLLTSPDTSIDHPDYRDTPLFLAAAGLHFDIMYSLLKKGADPTIRSSSIDRDTDIYPMGDITSRPKFGPTPLHAVCGGSHRGSSRTSDEEAAKKCAQILLDAGCDINAVDDLGKTPLHHSVTLGQPSKPHDVLVKLLLDNGADITRQDKFGNTPLHLVRLHNDFTGIIEVLMANGADITKRNSNYQTPVHTILESIQGCSIKSLLPHASNWNIKDSRGDTPLHIVLSKSYNPGKPLQDLLNVGADLGQRNKKGEAPIHVLQARIGSTVEKTLPDLLKAGADLNMRDFEGRTVLLRLLLNVCYVEDDYKSVRYLLEQGAEINVRDFEGNGPLHLVCNRSRGSSLLKVLLDAGADPLLVNHAGNTLLHELFSDHASHSDGAALVETAEFLLELGIPAGARNNTGQTALHFACGSKLASLRERSVDPIHFALNSEIGKSINAEDNNGIRPIHLASSISEHLLAKLIENGADATAVTYEGKNVLHITSGARQTNSIGFLLEHFCAIGRTDILDAPDDKGRTALHEACRSGRPESVALLLKAGANVNVKDKEGFSPLHACAEFPEENLFWSPAASRFIPPRRIGVCPLQEACGIRDLDPLRPHSGHSRILNHSNRSIWRTVCQEDHTVRIREIIQLLMDHGAEVTSGGQTPSAFRMAITNGASEMVDELLPHIEKDYAKAVKEKRRIHLNSLRGDQFSERYLIGMAQATVLESDIRRDGDNFYLLDALLALGKYSTIEQLPGMGVDLLYKASYRNDFFTTLAGFGYASLLKTLGTKISNPDWVNGKIGPAYVGGTSALHILASGTHWWHTEGLKYLLQYGANVELKNEYDQTPLHIAVSRSCGSYRSREVAKLLLEHGSNPDAKDSNGMTCLNNSMHDIGFVRLLIKHGADINLGDHPALFSSITTQDSSAVAMLLEAGADCNVRQKAVDKPKPLRPQVQERIQSHEYYPVHYAASTKFNTPKMRETAIQIVKLLLDNGADPFLNFRDDATIIHDVFEYGGILQPFLDIPNLDLERRDAKGRTLLLAAARSRFGTFSLSNFPHVPSFRGGMGWKELEAEQAKYKIGDPSPAQTIYDKGGDLLAVDNKGNNTIHFLTLAIPHNFDEYQKTFSLFIERAPSLVHQKNAEGWKPFHLAIKDRKTWVIESLINAGADPLERDPEGNTPLHHLASNMSQFDAETEWLAWWEKFVALGIPINAKNDRGETPVFEYFRGGRYYCENNHRKHFTPFEEAGADPFARNNEGETLLHIVATKAFTPGMWTTPEPDTADTFRFLMEKGLDPMAEDNSQRTALDVAAACRNSAVLALFKRDKGSVPVVN